MKAKQIYEFTRGNDPLSTLGIGYAATIYKFFDNLKEYVDRDDYTIKDKQIIFRKYLNLNCCKNLVELPDNLTIGGSLYLYDCINLIKLPNNLTVGDSLNLKRCMNLTELPNNLKVKSKIYVIPDQEQLINCILYSKFKKQLVYD